MKVLIDVGHGTNTFPPSKGIYLPNGGTFEEHDFNSKVGVEIKKLAEYNGFQVVYSQNPNSREVPLGTRIRNINNEHRKNPFVAIISLHANWSSSSNANGHGVFYWISSKNGKELAILWNKYANQILPNKQWGQGVIPSKLNHWTNFGILRDTLPPAILAEHFFFSNDKERELADTIDFINKSAEVSVRALCDFVGKEFKPLENKSTEKIPTEKKLYKVQVGAFGEKSNADDLLNELKNKGYNPIIVEENSKGEIVDNKKVKSYYIGNAHIMETNPDNVEIKVIGDTVSKVNGVNGTFFDLGLGTITNPESCVFIAMNNGKPISNNAQFNGWKAPARGTLIYHKNGDLGFRQLKSIQNIKDNTQWAIGGYMVKPYMDFKNEEIPKSVNYKTAHTYIGYDKAGKIYTIVKPNHNIYEIVPLLDELGITNCIVLDGGGSSQSNYNGVGYKSKRKVNTAVVFKED